MEQCRGQRCASFQSVDLSNKKSFCVLCDSKLHADVLFNLSDLGSDTSMRTDSFQEWTARGFATGQQLLMSFPDCIIVHRDQSQ